MKNQKGFIEGLGVAAIVLVAAVCLAALIAIPIYYVKGTQRQVTLTVNKEERVQASTGNSSKYLVYTDQGVFEDTDSILNGKFNSSDLYGQLQNDKRYDCTVYGWRIPFFSNYPNLVKCTENEPTI